MMLAVGTGNASRSKRNKKGRRFVAICKCISNSRDFVIYTWLFNPRHYLLSCKLFHCQCQLLHSSSTARVCLQDHIRNHTGGVHVAVSATRYASGLAAAQTTARFGYALGEALLPNRLQRKEKIRFRVGSVRKGSDFRLCRIGGESSVGRGLHAKRDVAASISVSAARFRVAHREELL